MGILMEFWGSPVIIWGAEEISEINLFFPVNPFRKGLPIFFFFSISSPPDHYWSSPYNIRCLSGFIISIVYPLIPIIPINPEADLWVKINPHKSPFPINPTSPEIDIG